MINEESGMMDSAYEIKRTMKQFVNFLLTTAVTMFLSCEQAEVYSLSGDLIGRVGAVMDEFGNLQVDRSGYIVTIEGTDPERNAITNSAGKFTIDDLETGTYNLIFSKPGYQTLEVFSYQFTGGNVPTYYEAPLLSQLSSTSITSFDAFATDENNPDTAKYTMVKIEFEINPVTTDDEPRTVITYINTSKEVSSENYQLQLNDPGLYKFTKWPKGTKLYAIAYPAPLACNAYYDPEKNQFTNSCLGVPTDIIEFIVP